MKIIISPAKKMNVDTDSFAYEQLPHFLEDTKKIAAVLQVMSEDALQKMWKCNDSIAKQNYERLAKLDLEKNLTPALFAYEGIQYQNMAPNVFEIKQLDYIREHLRILSGFYGVLSPFDGVVSYRLEMQGRVSVENTKDLYQFWGNKLAFFLEEETEFVLNLASKEYSKGIIPYLSHKTTCISCVFGELKEDKIVEKATLCKMARGQMVRWLAENNVTTCEEVKTFSMLGFAFLEERSTETHYVFVKNTLVSKK